MANPSVFPNAIDTFPVFEDIEERDIPQVYNFITAIMDTTQTVSQRKARALNALEAITNYENKILTASRLNLLFQAVLNLENYYKGPGAMSTINQKVNETRAILDNFAYCNEWVSTTNYSKNNVVLYNNKLWIATSDGRGKNPSSSPNFWRQFSIKGNDAVDTGDSVDFKGEWDSTVTYNANKFVQYGKGIYISIRTNIGKVPADNPNDWDKVIESIGNSVPVQDDTSGLPHIDGSIALISSNPTTSLQEVTSYSTSQTYAGVNDVTSGKKFFTYVNGTFTELTGERG